MQSCKTVTLGGTSYSLVQTLFTERLTDGQTDRQTDDIIMPIANNTV